MRIGGLLKFSLIDYPGKVAAVIFTQGCNYRCPFCHNPELVLPELFIEPILDSDIFTFLEKRKGQLQGVVVTGGEPTIHNDLPQFLQKIKAMGFLVKLDTNGSRPDVLQAVLDAKFVDFVAMDVKSSLENYCKATGAPADLEAVKMSIGIIKKAEVEHEFRTTALKTIVTDTDMAAIKERIGPGQNYIVKRGNLKDKVLDYNFFADQPDYSDEEWRKISRSYLGH
ncbi:MAG: anaerobic ribonucleoside-triphosphate reductase activating protein [Candidatus Omnitrophica bacterium]|nr:anaerobic ribonucleoside-triphosphate reductase activating protein [Candidatus Omnitrophota bacterium]